MKLFQFKCKQQLTVSNSIGQHPFNAYQPFVSLDNDWNLPNPVRITGGNLNLILKQMSSSGPPPFYCTKNVCCCSSNSITNLITFS